MKFFTPKYKKFDKYLWADFFELICLQTIERSLTQADLKDRIILDAQDDTLFTLEDEDANSFAPLSVTDKNDDIEIFLNDLLVFFNYRIKAYSEFYPFTINDDILEVQPNLTDKQLFYIYLLMSSHLKFFKNEMSTLTSDFEILSLNCLKEYFGSRANLYVFGKNSSHTSQMFRGSKVSKFNHLARLFSETSKIDETSFPATDTGDEGIDIVGWIGFSDESPGKVLITGQCKCQTEWPETRFSSSYDSLKGMMTLTHQNINFTLIPICFRNAFGEWYQSPKISGIIMVDRQRLVSLSNNLQEFLNSKSYHLVKLFTISKEEIV